MKGIKGQRIRGAWVDEAALFPIEETVVQKLNRFDKVRVRCAWGDELGHVIAVNHCRRTGFAEVEVELIRFPARVHVSAGNVVLLEDTDG